MNGNQEEVSRRCEAEKFGEELRRWCCLQLQSGVHRRTKAKVDLRQEGEQSSGSSAKQDFRSILVHVSIARRLNLFELEI